MTIKQTSQIAATLLCAILAITMIGGCNHAPSDKTESGATTTTTKATSVDNVGDGTTTSALMSDGVTELTGDSTTASTTITTIDSTTTSASESTTATTTTSKPTTKKTTSNPTSKKTTKKTTSSTTGTTKTTTKKTTLSALKENPYSKEIWEQIAQRVVYYINKFRVEEGNEPLTVLPGLTEVAERRAVQLTEKFEHNNEKYHQICTELKYGAYYDPSVYTHLNEAYYSAHAQEAICTGDGNTIDEIAYDHADVLHNSKAHWSYVGGAEEKFIAVGVAVKTFGWQPWRCCVLVAQWDVDASPEIPDDFSPRG